MGLHRFPGRCPWRWLSLGCVQLSRRGETVRVPSSESGCKGPQRGCGHHWWKQQPTSPLLPESWRGDRGSCVNSSLAQFLSTFLKEDVHVWVKMVNREVRPWAWNRCPPSLRFQNGLGKLHSLLPASFGQLELGRPSPLQPASRVASRLPGGQQPAGFGKQGAWKKVTWIL